MLGDNVLTEAEPLLRARVEVFYFGCCPYSYFFAYGGGFEDRSWTKTGGDFKAELEKLSVEVTEYNVLEHPELVRKLNLPIDPYNPFSNHTRFIIDGKEASKEDFFTQVRAIKGETTR